MYGFLDVDLTLELFGDPVQCSDVTAPASEDQIATITSVIDPENEVK